MKDELTNEQETEFLKPIHDSIIEGLNTPISECDDSFELGEIMKNVVRIQISTMGDKHPSKIVDEIRPNKFIREAWIAQTIADQVWVYYQFDTEDEAKSYFDSTNMPLEQIIIVRLLDSSDFGRVI